MNRWTLWRVQNGWLAVPDRTTIPDGFEGRGFGMATCAVFKTLTEFADYTEKKGGNKRDSNKKQRGS